MSRERQNVDTKRKIQRRNAWTTILIIIFCTGFVISAIQVSKIIVEKEDAIKAYSALRTDIQLREVNDNKQENATNESTPSISIDINDADIPTISERQMTFNFAALQEDNPNMVAWLTCDGTNIDYPVMHTDNNEYYLNHLYNGDANGSGSLFVDYRNTGLFTDQNTVIYGHHMQNGTMFNSLLEYKAQDFYDTHPTMMLYTPAGDFQLELICGTVEDGNYEFVRFDFENEKYFEDYVESLRARSTFVSSVILQPDDKIVSLCTCSYEWNNARYMLVGKLIPIYLNK